MKKLLQTQHGFTLIETLVVLICVGILVALVLIFSK
jgi:prepilin-type N-terminal cleavage/methylation domain-containing protein